MERAEPKMVLEAYKELLGHDIQCCNSEWYSLGPMHLRKDGERPIRSVCGITALYLVQCLKDGTLTSDFLCSFYVSEKDISDWACKTFSKEYVDDFTSGFDEEDVAQVTMERQGYRDGAESFRLVTEWNMNRE